MNKQNSQVTVSVGAQWGDEGKGKWIDELAKDYDIVARFQGGNNAGHTIYYNNHKTVLHLLPSGIFDPKIETMLCSGVVINPAQLIEEIAEVKRISDHPLKLHISGNAHVVTPWHIHLDKEVEKGDSSIGTTKKGIGPTYSDKTARRGLLFSEYLNEDLWQAWLDRHLGEEDFCEFYKNNGPLYDQMLRARQTLKPYLSPCEEKVRDAIKSGKKVLLEGAQGTLLDVSHGTYPYVTSSSTISGGAVANIGFDPRAITHIVGIAKAYLTRVGDGPFPTQIDDENGRMLQELGNEFGATTKRPRRCGWLDLVALKHAVDINGLDGIYLNKLDILTYFSNVKLCTAYKLPSGEVIKSMPEYMGQLGQVEPIYQEFEDFKQDISEVKDSSSLNPSIQNYLKTIEEYIGVPIFKIGTGPARHHQLSFHSN